MEDAEEMVRNRYAADALGALLRAISENQKLPLYSDLISTASRREKPLTAAEIKEMVISKLSAGEE